MFLLKDTTQRRRWGSNPRPLGLDHWATTLPQDVLAGAVTIFYSVLILFFYSTLNLNFKPDSQDNAFSLPHVWGAKTRQMMLLNFLIIFYYLMLNQIFPGLSTKIFRILHKLDENNHLNSSCQSQSWSGLFISPSSGAHHKIEFTAQNNTNFYMFISASGTPSSRKK